MKTRWTIALFLVLALAVTSCGARQEASEVASSVLDDTYADALSIRSQLVLGTLKLEETDLAVTPAQAAELLPLWQASRNLARSGTGATEEVNAVLDQIQAAMTPEQLAAIAEFKLTRADNQELSQALGLSTGTGEGTGTGGGQGQGQNLSAEERATRQAEREERGTVGASEALLDQLIEVLQARAE
jgi:hypothetical protein